MKGGKRITGKKVALGALTVGAAAYGLTRKTRKYEAVPDAAPPSGAATRTRRAAAAFGPSEADLQPKQSHWSDLEGFAQAKAAEDAGPPDHMEDFAKEAQGQGNRLGHRGSLKFSAPENEETVGLDFRRVTHYPSSSNYKNINGYPWYIACGGGQTFHLYFDITHQLQGRGTETTGYWTIVGGTTHTGKNLTHPIGQGGKWVCYNASRRHVPIGEEKGWRFILNEENKLYLEAFRKAVGSTAPLEEPPQVMGTDFWVGKLNVTEVLG